MIETVEGFVRKVIDEFVWSPHIPVYGSSVLDYLNEDSGGGFKLVSQSIEEREEENLVF